MASEDATERAQLTQAHAAAAQHRQALLTALLAAAVVMVAIGGAAYVYLQRRADQRSSERREVTGRVVDGRGTAPKTSFLLVQRPAQDGPPIRSWVRVERFNDYEVGTPVTLSVDRADPNDVRLGGCACEGPSALLLIAPVALAVVAAGGNRRATRARSEASALAGPDAGVQPTTEVRAWWTGNGPSGLNLYRAEPEDGTDDTAGAFLGRVSLPREYASLVRNGSFLTMVGVARPNRPVLLHCPAGPIAPDSRLQSTPGRWPALRGGTPRWPARSRDARVDPSPDVLRRRTTIEAISVAVTLPLAYLAIIATFADGRWAILAGLAAAAVIAAAAIATTLEVDESDLGSLDTIPFGHDVEDPVEPRVGVLRAELIGTPGDDRPLGESLVWLGTNLARAPLAIVWTLLAFVFPPVFLVAAALLLVWWLRQPRPVQARCRRPLTPWWLATCFALGAAGAAGVAFVADDPAPAMAIRIACAIGAIPLAGLAYRTAAAGLAVGRREWVLSNLLRTERFHADEVQEVRWEHPPGRPVRHRLEIVLTSGQVHTASRFAVPRRAGERLIERRAPPVPPIEPAPPSLAGPRPR